MRHSVLCGNKGEKAFYEINISHYEIKVNISYRDIYNKTVKYCKGEDLLKLKEIREDRDLTQQEIANILNCKQNTYQQYESGKRQIPIGALTKLCLYYGISADYILGLPKNLKYPDR